MLLNSCTVRRTYTSLGQTLRAAQIRQPNIVRKSTRPRKKQTSFQFFAVESRNEKITLHRFLRSETRRFILFFSFSEQPHTVRASAGMWGVIKRRNCPRSITAVVQYIQSTTKVHLVTAMGSQFQRQCFANRPRIRIELGIMSNRCSSCVREQVDFRR